MGSYLDKLLRGVKQVYHNGAPVGGGSGALEPIINFIGSVVLDDPTLGAIDVYISSTGGGSGGGGISVIESNGTPLTLEPALNFVGFSVTNDGANTRNTVTNASPTLTAGFTQPAVGGTIAITVTSTSLMVANSSWAYLGSATTDGGWYLVTAVADATHATLQNLGMSSSVRPFVLPTASVPNGSTITIAGAPSDPGYFDVRAYGAVPSDVGPAITAAMSAAIGKGGGVIYVPPLLDGTAWVLITNSITTSPAQAAYLTIRGSNTHIALQCNTSQSAIQLANMFSAGLTLEGLIFTGKPGIAQDCVSLLNVSQCFYLTIQDCRFLGVQATSGVIGTGSVTLVSIRRCTFGACSSLPPTGGTLQIAAFRILIDNCDCPDFGNYNGVNYSKLGSASHVYIFGGGASVEIRNSAFDEGVERTFWFDGSASELGNVHVHDCIINAPTEPSPGIIVVANSVKSMTFERIVSGGGGGSGSTVAFDLTDVETFKLLEWPQVSPGTTPTSQSQILLRTGLVGVGTVISESSSGWTYTITGAGFSWPLSRFVIDGADVPYRINHAGSPYTLNGAQAACVLADVSGGSITLTWPQTTTVTDNRKGRIVDVASSMNPNSVTVNRTGADTIQDPNNPGAAPATSIVLNLKGSATTLVAAVSEAKWLLE